MTINQTFLQTKPEEHRPITVAEAKDPKIFTQIRWVRRRVSNDTIGLNTRPLPENYTTAANYTRIRKLQPDEDDNKSNISANKTRAARTTLYGRPLLSYRRHLHRNENNRRPSTLTRIRKLQPDEDDNKSNISANKTRRTQTHHRRRNQGPQNLHSNSLSTTKSQ